MGKLAYSYIRFSGYAQQRGASLKRQSELAPRWCQENNATLSDLVLTDKGVSAFKGKHIREGALGEFLSLVKAGRVPKGSYLLVEQLDRLSRQEISEALSLFTGLLNSGVNIVTFLPYEKLYTKQSLNEVGTILEAVMAFHLAWLESEKKSKRIGDARNRARANLTKRIMTSKGPCWLKARGDKSGWEIIPAAVASVRLLFQLASQGYGMFEITKQLNRDRVPNIGKQGFKTWHEGTVHRILRNRAVIGEYQPHIYQDGTRVPTGEPVQGYYPAIVTEKEFYAVQAACDQRKRHRGRKGKHVSNLFTGLLFSADDGSIMRVINKRGKHRMLPLGAIRGIPKAAEYVSFSLDRFEQEVLQSIQGLASMICAEPEIDETAELSGRLATIEHRIKVIQQNLLGDGEVSSIMDALRQLEQEKASVRQKLDKARASKANSKAESFGEFVALIKVLEKEDTEETIGLRTQIRHHIRNIVKRIDVRIKVVGNPKHCQDRSAEVTIHFGTGGKKSLTILERPKQETASIDAEAIQM